MPTTDLAHADLDRGAVMDTMRPTKKTCDLVDRNETVAPLDPPEANLHQNHDVTVQATSRDGANPITNPTATTEASIDHAVQTQLATAATDNGAASPFPPEMRRKENRSGRADTDPSVRAVTKTTDTAPSAPTVGRGTTTITREATGPTAATHDASGDMRRIVHTAPVGITVDHASRAIARRKVEA
jgi:hypothetical protein